MSPRSFLSWGAAALLIAVSAEARPFEYTVEGYPLSDPHGHTDCHELAADLGTMFAARTGLQVTAAECLDISERGFDVKITYDAETTPLFVSTADYMPALDRGGFFATYEQCVAALPAEERTFRFETGLEPVIFPYCYKDTLTSKDPWGFKIEAIGHPAKKPYISGVTIFGAPLLDFLDLKQSVIRGLIARGVNARHVALRISPLEGRITAFYYAEMPIVMASDTLAKFKTEAQCREQLVFAEEAYRSSDDGLVVTFCSFVSAFHKYEISAIFFEGEPLRRRVSAERFVSYDVCVAERPDLIAKYKDTLHLPVLGGLCGRVDDSWKVVMFLTQ